MQRAFRELCHATSGLRHFLKDCVVHCSLAVAAHAMCQQPCQQRTKSGFHVDSNQIRVVEVSVPAIMYPFRLPNQTWYGGVDGGESLY